MIYSEIDEYAGLFLRGVKLVKAGDVHHGHRHHFDHVTLLTRGAVRIDWRDEDGSMGSEEHDAAENDVTIHIAASRWHEITALRDDTRWRCIFAMPDATTNLYMAERAD